MGFVGIIATCSLIRPSKARERSSFWGSLGIFLWSQEYSLRQQRLLLPSKGAKWCWLFSVLWAYFSLRILRERVSLSDIEAKGPQGRWVVGLLSGVLLSHSNQTGRLGFAILQWNFPLQKLSVVLGFKFNRKNTSPYSCKIFTKWCISHNFVQVLRLFFSTFVLRGGA